MLNLNRTLDTLLALHILDRIKTFSVSKEDTKVFYLSLGNSELSKTIYRGSFLKEIEGYSTDILGYKISLNDILYCSVVDVPDLDKAIDNNFIGRYATLDSEGFVAIRNQLNTEYLKQKFVIYVENGDYPDKQSLKDCNLVTVRSLGQYFLEACRDQDICTDILFTKHEKLLKESKFFDLFSVLNRLLLEATDFDLTRVVVFWLNTFSTMKVGDPTGLAKKVCENLPFIGLFKQREISEAADFSQTTRKTVTKTLEKRLQERIQNNLKLSRGTNLRSEYIDITRLSSEEVDLDLARKILDINDSGRLSRYFYEEAVDALGLDRRKERKTLIAKKDRIASISDLMEACRGGDSDYFSDLEEKFLDQSLMDAVDSLEKFNIEMSQQDVSRIKDAYNFVNRHADVLKKYAGPLQSYFESTLKRNSNASANSDVQSYRILILKKLLVELVGLENPNCINEIEIKYEVSSAVDESSWEEVIEPSVNYFIKSKLLPYLNTVTEVFSLRETGLKISIKRSKFEKIKRAAKGISFHVEFKGIRDEPIADVNFQISQEEFEHLNLQYSYAVDLLDWLNSNGSDPKKSLVYQIPNEVGENNGKAQEILLAEEFEGKWSGLGNFYKVHGDIQAETRALLEIFLDADFSNLGFCLEIQDVLERLDSHYKLMFEIVASGFQSLQNSMAQLAEKVLKLFWWDLVGKASVELSEFSPSMIHARRLEASLTLEYVIKNIENKSYRKKFISDTNRSTEIESNVKNSSFPGYIFMRDGEYLPECYRFNSCTMTKTSATKTSASEIALGKSFLRSIHSVLKYYFSLHKYSRDSLDIIFLNMVEYRTVMDSLRNIVDVNSRNNTAGTLINSFISFEKNDVVNHADFSQKLDRDNTQDSRLQAYFRGLDIPPINIGFHFEEAKDVRYLKNRNIAILYRPSARSSIKYEFDDITEFEEHEGFGSHRTSVPYSSTRLDEVEEYLNGGGHSDFINKYYYLSYLVKNPQKHRAQYKFKKCKRIYKIDEGLKQYLDYKERYYWVCLFDEIFNRHIVQHAVSELSADADYDVRTIIKYEAAILGKNVLNMAVVTSKSMSHLDEILRSRMREIGLDDVSDEMLLLLKKEASHLSGDIVLRATGLGQHSKEMFGLVLTKSLIERLSPFNGNRTAFQGWIYVDDYHQWMDRSTRPDLIFYEIYESAGHISCDIVCLEVKFYGTFRDRDRAIKQVLEGVDFLTKIFSEDYQFNDQKILVDSFISALKENLYSSKGHPNVEIVNRFEEQLNRFLSGAGPIPTINIYGSVCAYNYETTVSHKTIEQVLGDGNSYVADMPKFEKPHLSGGIYFFNFDPQNIKELFVEFFGKKKNLEFDISTLNRVSFDSSKLELEISQANDYSI